MPWVQSLTLTERVWVRRRCSWGPAGGWREHDLRTSVFSKEEMHHNHPNRLWQRPEQERENPEITPAMVTPTDQARFSSTFTQPEQIRAKTQTTPGSVELKVQQDLVEMNPTLLIWTRRQQVEALRCLQTANIPFRAAAAAAALPGDTAASGEAAMINNWKQHLMWVIQLPDKMKGEKSSRDGSEMEDVTGSQWLEGLTEQHVGNQREPRCSLHEWILMGIWLNMPTTLTVSPSGKMLTDPNKLVRQFELLMFGLLSFPRRSAWWGLSSRCFKGQRWHEDSCLSGLLPAVTPPPHRCHQKRISTFPPRREREPLWFMSNVEGKIPRKRHEGTFNGCSLRAPSLPAPALPVEAKLLAVSSSLQLHLNAAAKYSARTPAQRNLRLCSSKNAS